MYLLCRDLRNIGVPVGCGTISTFDDGWCWIKVGYQTRAKCLTCGNVVRVLEYVRKSELQQ